MLLVDIIPIRIEIIAIIPTGVILLCHIIRGKYVPNSYKTYKRAAKPLFNAFASSYRLIVRNILFIT